MSSIFTTTNKDKYNIVNIKDLSHGLFIDNSASTGFTVDENNMYIIDFMNKFVKMTKNKLNNNNIIAWNSEANIYNKNKNLVSNGGTDPSCIFKNNKTKKIFEECDVLFFLTDGSISNNSVEKFSELCKGLMNKTFIICGIIYNNKNNNNDDNISVFAPFFDSPNLICFKCNDFKYNKLQIIASKGQSPFKIGYQAYIDEFFNMKISDIYKNIPKNNLIVNETESNVLSMNIDSFLNIISENNITWEYIKDYVDVIDWDIILRHSKTNNKLKDIRKAIIKLEKLQIDYITEEIKKINKLPNVEKRDNLISEIVKNNNNNNEHCLELRKQLNNVIGYARVEEHKLSEYIRKEVSNYKSKWNYIKKKINDIEKASYTLNEFVFKSNRAMRADDVDISEIENLGSFLIHDNVPQINCLITLCEGPATLWLKNPESINYTTNDHCINFPLDYYPNLQNCLVANPISGDCANGYINSDTYNNKSLYNSPVNGFIPLNFSKNIRYITYQLNNILTNGKVLHHVKMLLLSMVDDNKDEWFMFLKEHIIKEILYNCYTTDTFSDEGEKMIIIEALKRISNNEQYIYRQPFCSAFRILKLAYKYADIKSEYIKRFAKRRFSYFLIEILSKILKPKDNKDYKLDEYSKFKENINNLLFDTICGIPINNSFHKVSINDIKTIFNNKCDKIYKFINQLSKELNCTPNNLINDEFLTAILYSLTNINEYKKPLTMFNDLITNNKFFRNAEILSETDVMNYIIKDKFDKYHKCNIDVTMPYSFYNGKYTCASKLFFGKEPLFTKNDNGVYNLQNFTNIICKRLDNKLNTLYGNTVPNNVSSHTCTHKIVSIVMEDMHPNKNNWKNNEFMDIAVKNCIDKLKSYEGKKGNIYDIENIIIIPYFIANFCDLRKNSINFEFKSECMMRTYKIKKELEINGISVINNELNFIDNKIKQPNILKEIYNLNSQEILDRVNKKYIKNIHK